MVVTDTLDGEQMVLADQEAARSGALPLLLRSHGRVEDFGAAGILLGAFPHAPCHDRQTSVTEVRKTPDPEVIKEWLLGE